LSGIGQPFKRQTMSKYTTFPNAPIVEAILDIKATPEDGVDLVRLATFQDSIKERFSKKTTKQTNKIGFQFSPEKGPTPLPPQSTISGYLFNSPAEHKTVQARMDGFTFNKLKPYGNWSSFRDEGRELWQLYSKVAKPSKIERIALRYINRIELPLPFKDFKEYFITAPEVAPELPQTISGFLIQIIIPNNEIESYAKVIMAMEKPTENKRLPIVFDIDVFKESGYVDNKEDIWDDFEKLREFKNEIFFNTITDKTKELFK